MARSPTDVDRATAAMIVTNIMVSGPKMAMLALEKREHTLI